MLLQNLRRVGMTGLVSTRRGGGRSSMLAKRLAFGVAALAVCAPAWAGPEGERVVAGQASFRRFGPQTMITASNGAIINYHAFNIGPLESVRFIQPSSDSRVLNRITGPDPSVIAGRLDANGIVYIMNPAGVYFRQGALVNVGQIYAGAARLSDADFLAGRNHFTEVSGAVVNEGTIHAQAAHLVGQVVSNAGTINASGGVVSMTSGDDVLIGEAGGNIYVRVNDRAQPGTGDTGASGSGGGGGGGAGGRSLGGGRGDAATGARVSNTGVINNEAGRTTMVAGDVYGMAIFGGGRIKSREVNIEGRGRGAVQIAGEIDARGTEPGQRGGNVTITGEHVRLTGATVDASGQAGGGRVLVGGDFQGGGDLRRASTTLVDGGSAIRVDGANAGTSGGTAVVWSDGTTGVYGAVSAQGGANGAGGLVETSGKASLDIRGATVRAGSAGGTAGTWLLDPSNVSIQDAASSNGSVNPVTGAYTITGDSAVINAADITSALAAGANVTIHTNFAGGTETGNITVGGSTAATINPTLTTDVTLTLQAANDITIANNASITPGGAGALGLVLSARDAAGGTVGPTGLVTISAALNIGSLSVSGRTITLDGGTITTSGNQSYVYSTPTPTQGLTLGAATTLTSTAGDITLGTPGALGTVRGANTLAINANAGTITFNTTVGNGASQPTSLTTSANAISITGGFLRTTGAQDHTGPVTINTPGNSFSFFGSNITFNSTLRSAVQGEESLVISSTGVTTFAGQVGGGGGDFASLFVSGTGGSIAIDGGSVRTTGNQVYVNAVTLGADTTLTVGSGANVQFMAALNGASAGQQSLTIAGDAVFADNVGATTLEFLDVSGTASISGDISTSTTQVYGGAVTLAGSAGTRTLTGSTVTFNGTVNGTTAGQQGLAITGAASFAQAVGGGTSLASLSVSGATALNGGAVTTTGAQTYTGAVTLNADATLNAGAGDITFGSTIDAFSATDRALTVNSTGTTTFGGAIGGTFDLSTLTTNAGGTTRLNGGAITTTGAVTFNDAVTLNADTTINAGAGDVTFASTLDAFDATDRALTVNSTGTTTFGGAIGGTFDLSTLTTNAGGTTRLNGGAITTSGAIAFNDAVTLNANTTISSGAGDVTFASTINSFNSTARNLTITSSGTTTLNGAIGGTNALGRLQTNGGGVTSLGAGTIVTSGATVIFDDAVTLTADTTITDSGGGIQFNNTVDSDGTARALTLNTPGGGSILLVGNVGATNALASLSTTTTGGLVILGNGSTAFTAAATGAFDFGGAVQLNSSSTLTSSGGAGVRFRGTIDSVSTARALTVNTAGATRFDASIGATTALSTLTTNAAGTTQIGNASGGGAATVTIRTSGAGGVNLGDAVLLDADTTITTTAIAGNAVFGSTIDSLNATARSLAVNVTGLTRFGGNVGATNQLSTLSTGNGGSTVFGNGAAGISIATSGNQTYSDAVTLGSTDDTTITLTSTGGTIAFGSTIEATGAGEQSLAITGNATFAGTIGAGTALGDLSITGATTFNAGATSVTTTSAGGSTGNQSYFGTVTLNTGNDTTVTLSSTGGQVEFFGAVNASTAGEQGLAITGNLFTAANLGGTTALRGLTVSGTADLGGNVTTTNAGGGTGNQTYSGVFTLVNANDTTITLTSTGGLVSFGSTVDGSVAGEQSLAVVGNVSFGGNVGAGTALGSLSATGGTIALPASVTTTNAGGASGNQTYASAITLTADTTLTATGGTVAFGSTVNGTTAGQEDLTIVGGASFGDAVGGTTALGTLSVSGATAITGGGLIITDGTQTFTGAVTLGTDTTFESITGDLVFGSTIDSADATARNVVFNSSGMTTFGGNIGSTFALGTFSTDAPGSTTINASSITLTGDASFGDDVVLGSDLTINATDVAFGGTLDGTVADQQGLTINTPMALGVISFGGAVGGGTQLEFLNLNGILTLTADTTFTIDSITLANIRSTGGAWNLTLNCAVDAAIGNTSNLDNSAAVNNLLSNGTGTTTLLAGSTIRTAGTQTYSSTGGTRVGGTVGQNATLIAGGDVTFSGAIDSVTGGSRGLIVDTPGNTTFSGAIGSTFALSRLRTLGGGTTTLGAGTITTDGATVIFDDAVILTADTTINDSGGGVFFNSTVDSDGTARALTVNASAGAVVFGNDIGGNASLDSLSVTAATTITFGSGNAGAFSVNADNNISLTGSTILLSDMTFASTAGGVTFDGTIDSFDSTAHSLAVNSSGLTLFRSDIGSTNAISEITTDAAGTTRLGDFANGGAATININTAGMASSFADTVLLGANVVIDAGAGDIAFGKTVDSVGATAFALAINTTGATSFADDVGAANDLDTLSVIGGAVSFGTGAGNIIVSTVNGQTYGGAATVNVGAGNSITFAATAGGVSFGSTLDAFTAGNDAVVVTNNASFGGNVGSSAALASISVGGAASIGGDITTTNAGGGTGDQTFSGAVTLIGANDSTYTLTSTGGLVSFGSAIDATTAGEQGLSVVGDAAFNGAVGAATALRDLAVSGMSAINTTTLSTTNAGGGTGNQTFTGAVTFGTGNDSTITFSAGAGTVAFGAAVDAATAGEQSILINGNASFAGDVGATNALGDLTVTGSVDLQGASISTTDAGGASGSQTYGGNFVLNTGDDSTVTFNATGGSVNFNGGLSGATAGEQAVVVNGDASIAGSTTVALASITVTGNTTLGNGNIDTTSAGGGSGDQSYGSVTLTGAPGSTTTLNAVGGTITLGDVEAQVDNGQSLAVNATGGGQTLFNGTVGAVNALASLSVTGGASINTTSIRTTDAGGGTGDQTFSGAITFGTGDDSTITFDASGGTVSFAGALDGQSAGEQAIVITGNASFGGAIGATTALASIAVGGTTTINGSSVVTTNAGGGSGNQTYTGAVTFTSGMGSTFTFNTTGGSVVFGSTLDGSGAGFESVVITGNATFGGIVGGTNALASLDVSGIASINTTSIRTTNVAGGTGNQTFGGAVVLGTPDDSTTTFTATGGTVAFNGTLDGTNAGEQSVAVAGNATFAGNVGGTAALGELTVSGTAGIGAVTITTSNVGGDSGNQTYSGAATLNGANGTAATLVSTGGLVTFASALNATAAGQQGLTITGNAALANVGATTALRSLSVSGASTLSGTSYATTNVGGGTGNQTYSGAVSLASAPGASVTFTASGGTAGFGSTLDASAAGAQTVTVNGNAAFTGAVGGINRLFRLNVAGAATVGNDVSTTMGQLFNGDLTLNRAGGDNMGLSTFDGGDGPMTFLGNINATASGQQGLRVRTTGTMRFEAGAASPNTFPTADGQIALFRTYQPPIGFGGSIGATTPLRSIEITTQRPLAPAVSTIVFAPGLTSENRVPDSLPTATIDGANFILRATDTLTFGYLDRVLAFGTLTIAGAGGNTLDSARIGDITALRAISITADEIAIRRRPGGFILGQTDGSPSNTVINNDRGVDFVARDSITFSVEPFVHDGDISAPTQVPGDVVRSSRIIAFATSDGSGVTVPNYATVQAFGDVAGQFLDRGPAPSPGFFLPFDLRSEGPVNTSISTTLAAFVVVTPPDIDQSTSLGSALRQELLEIAILTRDLDASELVEFLVGRALFDDRFESVPATTSLSAGGTGRQGVGVAVARLAADVVRKVLTNFKELKADQDAAREAIASSYERFLQTEAGQAAEFDARAFAAFVEQDGAGAQTRVTFEKLRVIFADIDQLGLGPVETAICKRKIVGFVRPSEMTDDELVRAVEARRSTASR